MLSELQELAQLQGCVDSLETGQPTYWSPLSAAGSYSAFAGVMAGIAVTILVLKLGLRNQNPEFSASTAWLPTTVISGVAATFFFSDIQGELECNRAAALTPIAGIMLAAAITQFLLAVALLVQEYEAHPIAQGSAISALLVTFALVAFALQISIGTSQRYIAGGRWNVFWGALVLVLPAVATWVIRVRMRHSWRRLSETLAWCTGIFAVVVLTVLFIVIGFKEPNGSFSAEILFPQWLKVALELVIAIVLFGCMLSCPWVVRPTRRPT